MKNYYFILFVFLYCNTAFAENTRDPFMQAHALHQKEINAKIHYENGLITLHWVQTEIHAALQEFAQQVGLNISLHEKIEGEISLHLNEVAWKDALDAILQSANLDKRYINDIIYIAPSELLAQNEEILLLSQQQQQALEKLDTHYVAIHYAKAETLAQLLKSKDNSLLSTRGQIGVDARTNTLIIQDLPTHLPAIYTLIQELDIPIQQVMIEARIVNAKHSFTQELGVDFNISSEDSPISFSANAAFNDLIAYDLPQQSAQLGMAIANLSNNILIDLEISAAESEDKTKVIASPRIITANQSEAIIKQGKQIAVEESTASGGTSVRFYDAVLELSVTPHITPDNRIILQLHVKQDVLGIFTQNGQPTIDTKSISTQVLVDNKATVVLGGIYSRTESDGVHRVPFLHQLPIIGHLFQTKNHLTDRDELLIFVTPTIIADESHTPSVIK